MEEPAHCLTRAPVLWDGPDCSVKQVGETLISNCCPVYIAILQQSHYCLVLHMYRLLVQLLHPHANYVYTGATAHH